MQTKLKRSLSLLLALGMVMGLLCGSAWAAEAEETDSATPRTEIAEAENEPMVEAVEATDEADSSTDSAADASVTEAKPTEAVSKEEKETEEAPKKEQKEQKRENSPVTMDTEGTCGDNLKWELNEDDEVLLISGTGEMWSYEAASAPWKDFTVSNVVIQSGVTSIGAYAFYNNSDLEGATIPASVVRIGKSAFENCECFFSVTYYGSEDSWSEIDIDEGNDALTDAYIEYDELEQDSGTCGENVEWKVENEVLTISGSGDMKDYGEIEAPWRSFYFKKVIIQDGVTGIGDNAFNNCESVKSISIANSVKRIGECAFYGCRISGVLTLPENLEVLGKGAFQGIGATSVNISASNASYCTVDGVLFSKDMTKVILYPNGTDSEAYTIPDTVTEIGDGAFYNAVLVNVTLPKGLTRIGAEAFAGCQCLTSITIPESLKCVGESAFSTYDDELKSVRISNLRAWCDITFEDYSANPLLPAEKLYLNDKLITELVIPEGVTKIGDYAFTGNNFKSVVIPTGVTSIGQNAFASSVELTSVSLPDSLTNISNHAFYYCTSLPEITIPDSVTEMGETVFAECIHLTEVTLSKNLKCINDYTFSDCAELRQITIPKNVTEVGSCAFYGCNKLSQVQYAGSYVDWEAITIEDENECLTDAEIIFGEEVAGKTNIATCSITLEQDSYLYDGEEKTPAVTVKDGDKVLTEGTDYTLTYRNNVDYGTAKAVVKGLGTYYGSKNVEFTILRPTSGTCDENLTWNVKDGVLTISGNGEMLLDMDWEDAPWHGLDFDKVVIEKGVTSIGDGAFCGEKITSITIPEGVTYIGKRAFEGCDYLTSITIPASVSYISDGEDGAFSGDGLAEIIVVEGNADYSSKDGVLFDKSQETLIYYPNGKTDAEYTVPAGVGIIGDIAFGGCKNIKSVKLQEGVQIIGDRAFIGCENLKTITIPKSMKKIVGCAFEGSGLNGGEVYYAGSEAEWKEIEIGEYNEELTDYATIHYGEDTPTVKPLSNCTITLGSDTYTYDGKAKAPTVTVKDGTTTLTAGTDYEVVYANNTDVGTAKATVIGKGNYTGTVEKTFQINAASLSKATVTLAQTSVTYTGAAQTPAAAVTLNGKTLSTADYKVAYQNNANAGTAKVTVTGKGNYTGTATATFTIAKAGNTVTASSVNKTTSAKAQSFRIGAKVKGGAKLTYKSNNKSITVDKNGKVTIAKNFVGKATITISAAATTNYNAAVKQIYVTVNPTGTKLSSVTSTKTGQLTIKWVKNAAVTGYQVQYATSSQFTGAKTLNVKSNKTVTSTLSKLKEKQKYYVRVRTYKTVGKVHYYSTWSAAKSATVKGVTAPAAVKLTSVKSTKAGEMTVKWGKNAKAGGYQLQYATAKNFKSAKTVAVKKAKTTSVTIKKLAKGKKYYVRVRTYQKVGGKTYYSAWSASKNVTIKK